MMKKEDKEMTVHRTEHELEVYLLAPDMLDKATKNAIDAHIAECNLCREQWTTLRSLYQQVDDRLSLPPSRRHEDLAHQLLTTESRALPERGLATSSLRETVESYVEVIEPYRRNPVQRFVRWARIHPYRFAGAVAFSLAALAMLTMTVTRTTKDMNPTFADVKKGKLSVYNKEGETIWTRAAFGIPDWDKPLSFQRKPEDFAYRFVGIEDIDGTGKNVVLVTGDGNGGVFAKDTLYCFEGDGTLRWRVYAGDPVLFGDKYWATQSRWGILDFFTLKETGSSKPRLFVISNAIQFFPNRLFEVDPANGRELASYLHAGPITCTNAADINGDGRSEILLGGMSRPYLQAMLIVLDPDNINGYGVCTPDFVVAGAAKAKEMYYILFPKTDVLKAENSDPYNMTNRILPGAKGFLQVFVDELPVGARTPARLVYSVGPGMKVDGALGNSFDTAHGKLKREGKITSTFDEAYRQNLLDSIQYWDGEKFVHAPAMNKRHAATRLLP